MEYIHYGIHLTIPCILPSGDTVGRPVLITDMGKKEDGSPVFFGHEFTHVSDFFDEKPIDSRKINLFKVRQNLSYILNTNVHTSSPLLSSLYDLYTLVFQFKLQHIWQCICY